MVRKATGALVLAATLAIYLLAAMPVAAAVVKTYNPPDAKKNLLLIGFGEFTMHMLSVDGNVRAFEDGNSWLKKDFTANYRTSLFADGNLNKWFTINGTAVVDSRIDDEYRTADPSIFRLKMSMKSTEPLWDGWRFTGQGIYDPQRIWEFENLDYRLLTQPQRPSQLELMARLESDKHGYIEGGSLRPSFKNTVFTLNQRSLFGAHADLTGGPVEVEGVGGKLEGKTYREGTVNGIRADGTAGPYDLLNAPVIRGSEQIKIETRDRFDQSTVLSSRLLTRDIDYSIDYLRGRIILNMPVASESISSDPNFIVIIYDYERTTNDDLAGGRVSLTPVSNINGGFSYLHRFIDANATGVGVEEPQNLTGGDMTLKADKIGTGYVEFARSDNPDTGKSCDAFRAGFASNINDRLSLNGEFQRIQDQFRSFTNSDLDPVKNQQRLHFGSTYNLSSRQSVTGGYSDIRGIDSNGQYNSYAGLRDENIYSIGYKNAFAEGFAFSLGGEKRTVKDRSDISHENNTQDRGIADISGHKGKLGLLGEFSYGVHYELIDFTNKTSAGPANALTNQGAISVTTSPVNAVRLEVIQKMRVRRNKDLKSYDQREDGSFGNLRIKPFTTLATLFTAEYHRLTTPGNGIQLWQSDPNQIEWSGTGAVEYLPLRSLKVVGKAGRHELQHWAVDSISRSAENFTLGQITYFATHHLSVSGETEFRRTAEYHPAFSHSDIWDLGTRLNWNRDRLTDFTVGMIRRREVQSLPPTPREISVSYILLLNGSMSLGKGFFARAAFKDILLRQALDDEKSLSEFEIGYEGQRWYRASIGYERIENETTLYPDRYYRGQGPFIRLSGKF
jgi:hypothetical protein